MGNFAATCLSDGLCHWICDLGHQCAVGMVCVEGLCYAGCFDGKCPSGRECVAAGDPHCRYSGDSTQDGGLNDGGGCTQCGDTCVDLQSDTAHCGACDHSCEGGACEEGTCRALRLTTFDFDFGGVLGQGLGDLYVTSGTSIYRCPKAGCDDPPDLVVTHPAVGDTIWLGADMGAFLYLRTTGGDVWMCESDTCIEPSLLWQQESDFLSGVALDPSDPSGLYLATDSGLVRCELGISPCTPAVIYSGSTRGVALRNGLLVFGVPTGVGDDIQLLSCMAPDCSSPTEVVAETTLGLWESSAMALGDTHVFWWSLAPGEPSRYAVYACPVGGCDPDPTAISSTSESPWALAASGLGAFYNLWDPRGLHGWVMYREEKQFEAARQVPSIVADDFYVFFLAADEGDPAGRLYRLAPW